MSDVIKEEDTLSHDLDQAALLSLAKQGKEVWNQWVESNQTMRVDFSNVNFEPNTDFGGFKFPRDTLFKGAKFEGAAIFEGAKFEGAVIFNYAEFVGYAGFRGAEFVGYAGFLKAKFGHHAWFEEVEFGDTAIFQGAKFGDNAMFVKAKFEGVAMFINAKFGSVAGFEEAKFSDFSSFGSINIGSSFDLTNSTFSSVPDFQSANNTEFIVLSNAHFSLGQPIGIIGRITFFLTGLRVVNEHTVSGIRYLRGVASKTHAIDVERDLNILERQAQIGVAWSGLKQWPWSGFKQWCSHLTTAISGSILMMLYGATSRYGRSIFWPFAWLIVSTIAYDRLYFWLYEKVRFLYPEAKNISSSVLDFTITSMVPFGSNVRPTYQAAVDNLFPTIGQTLPNGQILFEGRVPAIFQLASLTQGVMTLVFVFLIGLALRNFFRMK